MIASERVPTDFESIREYVARLRKRLGTNELGDLLLPPENAVSTSSRVAGASRVDEEALRRRWAVLRAPAGVQDQILTADAKRDAERYSANIENFIGTVSLPVGLAGPLRVRGLHANGDFYVPLATTEAALVASYSRGAQTISEAGGCTAAVIGESIGRSPVFAFATLGEAGKFVIWLSEHIKEVRQIAEATTRYGKLRDVRVTLEGNHAYLLFEYTTGDAAGQNMVTIATEAVCEWIVSNTPVAPEYWFVEGNMSGDKKASTQSFQSVRGRKVTAEVVLPAQLVQKRLHCRPEDIVSYYRASVLGGIMSGNIGIQGHYANGLAAMFIACGQDAACVAESAVGVTRMEMRPDGSLYVSVTLPNIIVGTVGGGTSLPTQQACLQILGLVGEGKSAALAEVCAGLLMAGELSICAAMAAGHFTQAHKKRTRGPK